jgi:hypothetical protein
VTSCSFIDRKGLTYQPADEGNKFLPKVSIYVSKHPRKTDSVGVYSEIHVAHVNRPLCTPVDITNGDSSLGVINPLTRSKPFKN